MAVLEIFLVRGPETSLFLVDQALRQQFFEILVECLHARTLTGLNRRIHLRDLAFANQVTNGGCSDHDFVRCDSTAADFL